MALLHKFLLQEESMPTTTCINMSAPSKNSSHDEIMHFLRLMEEIFPMGNKEMKLVPSKHADVCAHLAEAHFPCKGSL